MDVGAELGKLRLPTIRVMFPYCSAPIATAVSNSKGGMNTMIRAWIVSSLERLVYMSCWTAVVCCCSVVLAGSLSWAQITNVTDETSTPLPGTGHDYIGLLSETVNPANGSISLRINAPLPKGR